MSAPPPGPRCARCGCFAQEHQHLVDETWHLVPARCLTCDCEGFVLPKNESVEVVEVEAL